MGGKPPDQDAGTGGGVVRHQEPLPSSGVEKIDNLATAKRPLLLRAAAVAVFAWSRTLVENQVKQWFAGK